MKNFLNLSVSLAAVLTLTACADIQDKLSKIGQSPPMSAIQNPVSQNGYKPVALPMPPQEALNTNANSLWQPARQTFFKDQRAGKIGDILTVLINIKDQADMKNKTERSRSGSEKVGMPNLFGLETMLGKVLPDAVDPSSLVSAGSDSETTGDGKINRKEDISLKLAAIITQVLPNGNLVLEGRQEVRVNYELRELTLQGVIRPEDILNNNSISYEKIAEARISYGGQGTMSNIQQPRYGEQVIDTISPF